jgi:hypothetical protein
VSTIAAVDLDRTIIYSAAALGLPEDAHADEPRLVCVELFGGVPASFVTERAAEVLARLASGGSLVPATTRTQRQFARVHLPGPVSRFAICANGGHLLVDGRSDVEWQRQVRVLLDATAAPVEEIMRTFADPSLPFLLRTRQAEDLFVYAIVDRDALPRAYVDDFARWCAERGWRVSLQGRKLYAVPVELTKGAALREIARRAGADLVLAAGDSLLDVDLFAAADAGVRPGHGELSDVGWTAPHITTLTEVGVLAGERILDWLEARVAAGVGR